jgi:8-oxo-dGTP diphosphatase
VTTPRLVQTTDWTLWEAPIQATLVFLIKGDQVLLIHKKTGLGQGKVNAPGGKLEKNECFLECAHRELKEEVNLTVSHLIETAHLRFFNVRSSRFRM